MVVRNSDEKDERLAQLLDGLVEGSRHGKQPELEAVIAANPDLAAELRELWATAMIAIPIFFPF